MDYFNAAFGGFAPHRDPDAAIKFSLNVVLMDHRLDELAEVLKDGSSVGGMEGEPGWSLERRDIADEGNEAAYPGWPSGARFKAEVNQEAFALSNPVRFMTRAEFVHYVFLAAEAYAAFNASAGAQAAVGAVRAEADAVE
jgi:hypothetical protein